MNNEIAKIIENNWGKVLFCIDIIRNFAIANKSKSQGADLRHTREYFAPSKHPLSLRVAIGFMAGKTNARRRRRRFQSGAEKEPKQKLNFNH